MQYIDIFIEHYGPEGTALAVAVLVLFFVQLYYYIFVYGAIPGYKNNRRKSVLTTEPPVSVIIPMFSEDYTFVEEHLPLILAQEYHDFEVVIVYIGHDTDFYDDLSRLKQTFPQITTTKIHLDPRFPISRKMALNVGIKSAHNEHLIFSSTNVYPQSDRWLSLMAKGFVKGDIVLGYCGIEQESGFANYMMRTWRVMHSANWIAAAIRRHPYRGMLQNIGFTKNLYFAVKGFNCLNMNIGDDDLFMQKIMTADNVSVILSPRASLCEKTWGQFGWWWAQLRYFGSAYKLYPQSIKNFVEWEVGSRALFFITTIGAIATMPVEYKVAAATLMLIRYIIVIIEVGRVGKRLGESGLCLRYFLYDILGPIYAVILGISLMRRDDRVWR